MNEIKPLDHQIFDIADLMENHPPLWQNRNKQLVFEISSPHGCEHYGQMVFNRWPPIPLPETTDLSSSRAIIEICENVYDYMPSPVFKNAVEWHVNFADPELFGYYGSSLFAQDEMQVAEHPALGSMREALLTQMDRIMTVENGKPTPITITGVQRRCRVDTDINLSSNRIQSLYGNGFGQADQLVVQEATTAIDPPTITNLIAMAAPVGGYGKYKIHQIRYVLDTAFTSFRTAIQESKRINGTRAAVLVHSGFWGCGAFGGNRVLMSILQVIAAQMAGVDQLVMHTYDTSGKNSLIEAIAVIRSELEQYSSIPTSELVNLISTLGFEWGVSDGN